MGSKSRGLPASAALSERQAYWLKHIRAAEGRGEPLKQYAARKGLSEHSLYEAKRRLRDLGVLAAASPRKQTPAPARASRGSRYPRPRA